MTSKILPKQPEVNIGTLGHVDNGKTTIVQSISGVWTARHSEELKRGITIRVGYADAPIYRCPSCEEPYNYTTKEVCPRCGSKTEFERTISFIDCPGHHSLMVTMLSSASLFDGALFVVDARFKFPQLQDSEHFHAVKILGINKLIFSQNKIDLVTKERALENYDEIREFIRNSEVAGVPIIPVSGQHNLGIDVLLYAIQKYILTPQRKLDSPFMMPILRSFDVNPPGTRADELKGGVIGGSIIQGKVQVDDEIEVAPGLPKKQDNLQEKYEPLYTRVVNIHAGGRSVKEAMSGGLTGIETELDPSLTKSDGLTGNIAGKPGALPPTMYHLHLEYELFSKVVGLEGDIEVKSLAEREPLVINAYSAVAKGVVTKKTGTSVELTLTRPICVNVGDKVTISRKIGAGWRLIGYGIVR
ncbi:MAG: translation initiation factor IF-2 subunit gamma [Nitrososphaerota archaeon]